VRPPRTHWLGGLQTARSWWADGWPCCCTGDEAILRAETDPGTRIPERVTCQACRRRMARSTSPTIAKYGVR